MNISLTQAIIATLGSMLIICCERAFPFVLFSKKNPPAVIRFIEKFIPPMVMAALLFYSLKDVSFTGGTVNFVPALAGVGITVLLHLWKHNTLLSISGGTILYMILIRIL